MNDLPPNWEALESEYNKHYDPLADVCSYCRAQDSFEERYDLFGEFYRVYCTSCGEKIDEY